ncbi:MAG TPA: hypothetical protein ENN76_03105, partial [Euryarchaeota archaeon]|nr:hypothetical protein [Euryarchaeota archaeon]
MKITMHGPQIARLIIVVSVAFLLLSMGLSGQFLPDTEETFFDQDMNEPLHEPFERNVRVNEIFDADSRLAPRVANDGNGKVYVTWMERRSGQWNIRFAVSTNNGTTFDLEHDLTSSEPSTSPHQYPDIALGPNGEIYIVYQGVIDTITRIYLKKSVDGGLTFSPAVEVDTASPATVQWKPTVDVANNGNVHVAWTDFRYGNHTIFSAMSSNGGASFFSGVQVSDSLDNARDSPDIAVGGNGYVYIVWYDNRNYFGPPPGSDFDIYFSRSTNGGATFSPNVRIEDNPEGLDSYSPKVASDDAGRVYVVWDQNSQIMFSKSNDGGVTFSKDLLITNDLEDVSHQAPFIVVSKDGQTILVSWSDYRSGSMDVYFSKSVNGGASFGADRFFFDSFHGTSGVYDPGEAVLLDNHNSLLDPGVLDGVDSPDRILIPGDADMKLESDTIFKRLYYHDLNSNGKWDRNEDIVYSTWVPLVRPKAICTWDNTGQPISHLYEDDPAGFSFFYRVAPGQVIGIETWNTDPSKLPQYTLLDRVQIKMVYSTSPGYLGTQPVKIDMGGGNITTGFTPVDTNGIEVTQYIDIKWLGVDTIGMLSNINVSFKNTDGVANVDIDQMVIYLKVKR